MEFLKPTDDAPYGRIAIGIQLAGPPRKDLPWYNQSNAPCGGLTLATARATSFEGGFKIHAGFTAGSALAPILAIRHSRNWLNTAKGKIISGFVSACIKNPFFNSPYAPKELSEHQYAWVNI